MEFCCPYCHAPIYSRKSKLCGVCERPLPKELLLSDEQTAFLNREMADEEKRAKEFGQQLKNLGPHDSGTGFGSF